MSLKAKLGPVLKRYTALSNALDILANKRLTLLSCDKWDDTNDAYYIELYRQKKGAGSVLALCFTMTRETYHHWRVFSSGIEGICLEFERVPLQRALRPVTSRAGRVEYVTLEDIEKEAFEIAQLPLLKRFGYSDEREWRALVTRPETNIRTHHVDIPLSTIKRVIVSPWAPSSLFETLRSIIHAIPGCRSIKVVKSSLISNARWKAAGDALAAQTRPR